MQDRLDNMLQELVTMAEQQIEIAKEGQLFTRDFAEATCIILSMAYGRWSHDD